MQLIKSLWKKMKRTRSKFDPGFCFATNEAKFWLSFEEIEMAISRHLRGDWGGVSEEVAAANEFARTNGGQIRSLYGMKGGIEFEVRTQTETIVDVIGYPTEYGYDDEMLDEDLCH